MVKQNCIHDVFQTCQQIVSNHSLGYKNPQGGSRIFGYAGCLILLRLLLKSIFLLLSFLLLPISLSLSEYWLPFSITPVFFWWYLDSCSKAREEFLFFFFWSREEFRILMQHHFCIRYSESLKNVGICDIKFNHFMLI